MAGITLIMFERWGNAIELKATCSKNTTGKPRSFTGQLCFGDNLTITQLAAGSLVQVTEPADASSDSFTVNMDASGGIARVVLKNNDTKSLWLNCITYDSTGGSAWAPSYNTATGNTGFNQSKTIEPGTSSYYYWQVPKNTTGKDRVQMINFHTADYSINITGRIKQSADNVTSTQTVTFDANGGSCSTSSKTYTIGSTYGSLPTPTRTGYTFAGWYTSSSGGTQVTAGSTVSTATARTLYAQWTAGTQTVTFDANGGSCSTSSKTYTIGSTYGSLPAPTWSGHTFDGWYTSGGTKITASSTVGTSTSLTLYAHWTATGKPNLEFYLRSDWPAPVFLSSKPSSMEPETAFSTTDTLYVAFCYDNNGTADAGPHRVAVFVSDTNLTEVLAVREHEYQSLQTDYHRRGTNDSFDVSLAPGTYLMNVWLDYTYLLDELDEGDNLYSVEFTVAAPVQTVTFDANGGSCSTSSKTYTIGSTYGSLPTPTRTGYAFAGWYTSSSGGTQVTAGSTVTTSTTRTLYAQWTLEGQPNLTFYTPNGWPSSVFLSSKPERTTPQTVFSTTDTLYVAFCYANFGTADADAHSVGWIVVTNETATETLSGNVHEWALPTNYYRPWTNDYCTAPKTPGSYLFYLELDYENAVEESDEEDNVYTLEFEVVAPTQTVAFNANGGTCTTPTKTYIMGGLYTTLPTATRTGYTFAGWWTSASGGTQITAGSTVSTDSARTLYAHWTAGGQTVTFNANGGSCSTNAKTYTIGNTYGSLPTAIRTGYTFAGWWTSASGGTQITASSTVSTDSTRVLYAHWTAGTQTVTFNANGGSCSTNAKTYTTGSTYGSLPTATRTGYTFAGWWTSASGGPRMTASSTVSTDSTRMLYAHWTAGTQTVTFDANGGSCSTSSKTYTIGSTYGSLPTPTRTGYTFAGWYTSSSGGTQVTAGSTVSTATARTLYAQWTAGTQTVAFDANGGDCSTSTKTYTVGNTYGSLPTATRMGYLFDGWWTAAANGTQVTATTVVTTDETLRLYAHWNPESAATSVRFAFGTDGGVQTLVLAGGNSTSQSNPMAWIENDLQVSLAGGTRTTTLTVTCAANSGAKRMGILTVTVDGTVYTVEVVQDGVFGVAEYAVDSDSGLFQVKWVGESGKTYTLQRAQSLAGPWTSAGSVTAPADGIVSLDAAMPGKWTSGFYRRATAE